MFVTQYMYINNKTSINACLSTELVQWLACLTCDRPLVSSNSHQRLPLFYLLVLVDVIATVFLKLVYQKYYTNVLF